MQPDLPQRTDLLTEVHFGMVIGLQSAGALQLGPGQDEQPAQVVLIHFPHRVQEIAVEGHQATDNGANSRVTVRRSVRVHPWGGIIRSA